MTKKKKPLVALKIDPKTLTPGLRLSTAIETFTKLKSNELLISRGSDPGFTIRDYTYHLTRFHLWYAQRKVKREIRETKSGPKKSLEGITTRYIQTTTLSEVSQTR